MPRTRFEELFGDEAQEFFTTPTLSDVVPGLVQGLDSGFSSKELNPRREAVTGRSFRSPRIRSTLPSDKSISAPRREVEQIASEDLPPDIVQETMGGGNEYGGTGLIPQQVESGGGEGGSTGGYDPMGHAQVQSAVKQLGGYGLMSALSTVGAGISMGAPAKMIAQAVPAGFIGGALNPAVLANVVGGELIAGHLAEDAIKEPMEQGYPIDEFDIPDLKAEIYNEIRNPAGAMGYGVQGLASMVSNIQSPPEEASEAAAQLAAGETRADPSITTGSPGFEPPGAGGIGGIGTNEILQSESKPAWQVYQERQRRENTRSGRGITGVGTDYGSIQSDWEGITADIEGGGSGGSGADK